jgi:hypothetical protein
MKTNKKSVKSHIYEADTRLAGGYGPSAAKQSNEATLRRLVMSNMLFEDIAYVDGKTVVDQIKALIPKVEPPVVAQMAIDARYEQKLRHVPLLLVREMARHDAYKSFVSDTLAAVCKRPDETAEFLALYWASNDGKKTLSHQVKKGLGLAFANYNEYQLAKWNKQDREIKLRDVLFLSHAKPANAEQEKLFKRLVDNTLAIPDTWEVGLSACHSDTEKKVVWERMIEDGTLPAFAFMKNIRNMEQHGVSKKMMKKAFANCKTDMLLPIDFLKAYQNTTEWKREVEDLMLRCAGQWPKLSGFTTLVIDVSGSMACKISANSDYNRYQVAASLAVLASQCCDHVTIFATAGNDSTREMAIEKIKPLRGFALADEIIASAHRLGGGGIFTRQVCNYLREHDESADRLLIFSDSQDCDYMGSGLPKPHAKRNYIIDVGGNAKGVNYKGIWDAEISGWSESLLKYIACLEQTVYN